MRPSDWEISEVREKLITIIEKYEKILSETRRYVCRSERQLMKEAGVKFAVRNWTSLSSTLKRAEGIILQFNKENQCILLLEELEAEGRRMSFNKFCRESGVYIDWIRQQPHIHQRILALTGKKENLVIDIQARKTADKANITQKEYEQLRQDNLAKLEAYARRTMNA
jgi:hypothetical protein